MVLSKCLRQGSIVPGNRGIATTGGDPRHRKRNSDAGGGYTEESRKAADMTDDELAAIASGAKLTVV
jgi:hypothetical protein